MKMKKTLICAAVIALSSNLYAEKEVINHQAENNKILEKLGLPIPGSGIKVVPRSMMNLDADLMEEGKKAEEEIKKQGYVNRYLEEPKELLNFKETVSREMKMTKVLSDTSTDLRSDVSELKLAFDYEGLNNEANLSGGDGITVYAAVPQGAFNPESGGWSGAVQFFDDKRIGSCSYGLMNVKAANSAVEIAQEDVTYIINNKATLSAVEGSPNSGFLYTVKWYDETNFHELVCANMKYSPETTAAVIELANKIDKQ
jgi:hypothetical protein